MSDQRIEELSLRLDSLASQVGDLADAVQRLTLASSQQSGYSRGSFELLSSSPARAPSASGVSVASSNGDYNRLAELIPKIPTSLVASCSALRGGCLDFKRRAERAWESGYWARFVLQGEIAKPRPSVAFDLPNSVYVVLRAPGYSCPLFVRSAGLYRTIVGDFRLGSATLSHGFASLAEAKVYCSAAGVEFPEAPFCNDFAARRRTSALSFGVATGCGCGPGRSRPMHDHYETSRRGVTCSTCWASSCRSPTISLYAPRSCASGSSYSSCNPWRGFRRRVRNYSGCRGSRGAIGRCFRCCGESFGELYSRCRIRTTRDGVQCGYWHFARCSRAFGQSKRVGTDCRPRESRLLLSRGRRRGHTKGRRPKGDKGESQGKNGRKGETSHSSASGRAYLQLCQGHSSDGRYLANYPRGAESHADVDRRADDDPGSKTYTGACSNEHAELGQADGVASKGQGASADATASQKAKVGVPTRLSSGCARASRGEPRDNGCIRFDLSPSGARAESSIDEPCGPSSIRRGSPSRPKCQQHLNVFQRCSGQGEIAEGTGSQIRRLLPVSASECIPETEASLEASRDFAGDRRERRQHADLPGKIRRLRWCARHRHCPICSQLCDRLCNQRRSGGRSRVLRLIGSWSGTGCPGSGQVGSGFSVDAHGGPTIPDVGIQGDRCSTHGENESIRSTLSTALGNDSAGIHQGDRLHPDAAAGPGKESAACCSEHSSAKTLGPKEEGPLSKRRKARRCSGSSSGKLKLTEVCDVSFSNDAGCFPCSAQGPYGSVLEDEIQKATALPSHRHKVLELKEISFEAWSPMMLRNVLASRTPFSYFVSQCLLVCRGPRSSASSALFPLPFPRGECWGGGLKKLGSSRRARLAVRRALFLVISALNFMHFQAPLNVVSDLWRCPSSCHVKVFDRLSALIRARGPAQCFSVLGCGRKAHQLVARLDELVAAVESFGLDDESFYSRAHSGTEVKIVNDRDELVPYRPLQASRLKLSGEGLWDCREFLSDLLFLPYVEPRVNQYEVTPPSEILPDLQKVPEEHVFELCKIWDAKKLLRIYPRALGPQHLWGFTRVFNNFKNTTTDRQIGDRRGMNFCEGKVLGGPSHTLPTAATMLQICPKRFQQRLLGSIADRKDFYHQFAVTDERASTNAVFPTFHLSGFKGFRAEEIFMRDFPMKQKYDRAKHGDFLHGPRRSLLVEEDPEVVACFAALFQGDHLGVEFATDAHSRLLAAHGLIVQEHRLESSRPLVNDDWVSGLVIDDFFVLSKEPLTLEPGDISVSERMFRKAKEVYSQEGLLGSDDKDVVAEEIYKVCGGEVISSVESVRRGVVAVAAPFEKRISLAVLTSIACRLPYTSDALHACLTGSWVATLLLRRPVIAMMNEVFHVIPAEELEPDSPTARPFPRKAASELLVLACLAPVLASNIAAPFHSEIFATDASNEKGGVVSAHVGEELSAVLWRSAEKKRDAPLLTSPAQAILAMYDNMYEECPPEGGGDAYAREASAPQHVSRPIGLHYEFIEVCGGAAVVTKELLELGVVCGPVLDISISSHFDLTQHRVIEWVIFLLEDDRLQSFLVAPPCTSFSPAAFPAVRSYKNPRGFDQTNQKVILGNRLAFASLVLLMVALRLRKLGLGETPRRSKMRWLREWQQLIALGAREVWLSSCMYGSIHQKEFSFLGVNMYVEILHRRCSRDHDHVRIQGKYTKGSATYTPGLARALAIFFRDHLRAKTQCERRLETRWQGLEDVLTNDLCCGLQWNFHSSWRWRGFSHINVLETAAALKLLRDLAKRGGDVRVVMLIDSYVALSCITRGRSSAKALQGLLKKIAAVSAAYGIYAAPRYAPTRLNPGDCPTRDLALPEPSSSNLFSTSSPHGLFKLSRCAGLRRWISNWTRLILLLNPAIFLLDFSSSRKPVLPAADSLWILTQPLDFLGRGLLVLGFGLGFFP